MEKVKVTETVKSTGFYKRILPSMSDEKARKLERMEENLKKDIFAFAKKTFSII